MAQSKHTPGPWSHYDDRRSTQRHEVVALGRTVARIYYSDDQGAADARLIAAAPELLAAAKLALSEAESWIHDQLDGTSALEPALARLAPARAAIAKAIGGGNG